MRGHTNSLHILLFPWWTREKKLSKGRVTTWRPNRKTNQKKIQRKKEKKVKTLALVSRLRLWCSLKVTWLGDTSHTAQPVMCVAHCLSASLTPAHSHTVSFSPTQCALHSIGKTHSCQHHRMAANVSILQTPPLPQPFWPDKSSSSRKKNANGMVYPWLLSFRYTDLFERRILFPTLPILASFEMFTTSSQRTQTDRKWWKSTAV